MRMASGQSPTPVKVTVTSRGDLDRKARFFTTGDCEKLVYCTYEAFPATRRRLGSVATVIEGGPRVDMGCVAADLHDRGVRRLMVEGGGSVNTQFLTADLADELQLVVAPLFVGEHSAQVSSGPMHRVRPSVRLAQCVSIVHSTQAEAGVIPGRAWQIGRVGMEPAQSSSASHSYPSTTSMARSSSASAGTQLERSPTSRSP